MIAETAYDIGCRLYASGRYAEAEVAFRRCLEQYPDNPDLLNALGSAIERRGDIDQATSYLERACRLRPDSAPFRYNLANLLRRRGERERAETEYLEAIRYNPELAEAFHGLGSLYLEDGRLEPAEACLQRAVTMAPEFVPALHDLGQLCQRQGRLEEAEQLFRRSIAADVSFLPALNSLGMLLLRQNKLDESRRCFEQAIHSNPAYLQARCNLAVLDTWCGRFDLAINEFQKALEVAPEDADIHFNLSLALLSSGRMAEGWQEHEWRFRKAKPVASRHAEIPRWWGEPLAGKRILIHSEQGYGDSLQFIRYAALLARQGATVFVEGQDLKITPLLATVPGVAAAFSREEPLPTIDLQIPMMSLPLAIGNAAWHPPAGPYLAPSADKKSFWKKRLDCLPDLKVGLAWAGRPEHDNDANRSIPGKMLADLGVVSGISFVSLQIGCGNVRDIPFDLLDPASEVHDFCDSAALVSMLDLVITIDSAVAHLAGGLGIPVWLLLPWNPDWRWMHWRSDCDWYPQMTIFRQTTPGRWDDVIASIARELAKLSPADPADCRNMAVAMLGKGDVDRALEYIRKAIKQDPDDILSWRLLVDIAIRFEHPLEMEQFPEEDFFRALHKNCNHLDELAAIGLFFMHRASFYSVLFREAANYKAIDDLYADGVLEPVLNCNILKRLCETVILCDPDMERLLTCLRRGLLCSSGTPEATGRLSGEYFSFICALAIQCFNNEYVFAETEEEVPLYQRLHDAVESGDLTLRQAPGLIVLLATYYPLHRLKSADTLLASAAFSDNSALRKLLQIQIAEPLEEKRLAASIPRLGAIDDDVSVRVRQQYEENPYPRWVGIRLPKPRPMAVVLTGLFPHLEIDEGLDLSHPFILVAGCGTGQHPVYTLARFDGSKVLAVDLSLASLAYAMRKTREMGVVSIEFLQADIMALGSINTRFDMIECGGVLHHLSDPVGGWKILLGLLKPGGIMGVGLYSRMARRYVNQVRDQNKLNDTVSCPENIRLIRQKILTESRSSGLAAILKSRDFYSMSGCRDLLFHVQEHQFDPKHLSLILRELDLEFLGFQLPEHVTRRYRTRFPEDPNLTDLVCWQQYEEENPDTFINMYQFHVRKCGPGC